MDSLVGCSKDSRSFFHSSLAATYANFTLKIHFFHVNNAWNLQVIQGYCSYYLFEMYFNMDCAEDWQVVALACLFAVITLGNVVTTVIVVYRKYAEGANGPQLVTKYRLKAI